jgi:hypothetical protein
MQKILHVLFGFWVSSCVYWPAVADSWDWANDPTHFDSQLEYRFDQLPLKAAVPANETPWSESFWPRIKGSINYRWNTPNPTGFNLRSPVRTEIGSMSIPQLATLSPAEKFDLARGFYDYPLSTKIAQVYANRNAKEWEGVCDGWSASAIQFKEPKAIVFTNPDGLKIPFGSSDIKGLMSFFAASQDLGSVVIGQYCSRGSRILNRNRCDDVNPGTYHLLLANSIGLKQKAIIADVDPNYQTWNQPVYGYEFTVLGSARTNSGGRGIRIHSKMLYTDELEVSQWEPVVGTPFFLGAVLESEYILELDSQGRITGGEWLNSNHPDVLWKATKSIQFSGEFELLNKLYQPN